jgi:polysaccharide biosynthesis/export protein
LLSDIFYNMTRYLNAIAILCVILMASCSAPKKVVYFKADTPNDSIITYQPLQNRPDVVIQPDDILSINVSSVTGITEKDPLGIFNSGGTEYNIVASSTSTGGASQTAVKGFLVDKDGNIDFPVIGKININGMPLRKVKELMAQKLQPYLKDPVVEVRIINFKVTLLGEVSRVGQVVAPNQRMTIIEAIAAAGDIPITGKRENVLIVREHNGIREFGHINLNSKNVFTSQYYYLQQNDIVYVEPSRVRRQESNDFLRFYLPTITTFLSTALAVYGIVQLTK